MRILGIDPGLDGGIALLTKNGSLLLEVRRAGVSNTTLSGPANGWTADCLQRARRMHRRSNAIQVRRESWPMAREECRES